jgi:uncharacterized protein involved in exopolysaccharide biosynthesis
VHTKILENHNHVSSAYANQVNELEQKRIDMENERQKLMLENKKLAKLKEMERDLQRQTDMLQTMQTESSPRMS